MTPIFRVTTSGEPGLTLRLDGWLSGSSVGELRAACASLRGAFVVDVSNLRFADEHGISLLKHLEAGGASLVGAGLFLATALR